MSDRTSDSLPWRNKILCGDAGQVLGQLPDQCVIYAIEAASFEMGAPLSPRVAAGVVEVAGRVLAEIANYANLEGSQHA